MARRPNPPHPELFRMYSGGAYNPWAHVDARDAAQAIDLGCTTAYDGSHTLFINNRHNTLCTNPRVLGELFFLEVTDWRCPMQGTEALVSIRTRKRVAWVRARVRGTVGYIVENPRHPPPRQSLGLQLADATASPGTVRRAHETTSPGARDAVEGPRGERTRQPARNCITPRLPSPLCSLGNWIR